MVGASRRGSPYSACCTLPQKSTLSRRSRSMTSGAASLQGQTCGWWARVVSTSTTVEAHRDREAHRADLARERRLVEIDWQRIGFTSPQLLYEAASIIAGMDRLLGRTWSPRLARWQAMLDDSLLR